jgi:hypothetical protein
MNINFLWIGSKLNKLSQLGLKSFLDHGHDVVLWIYDKTCENIPSGVKIEDAGQIIHPDKVFLYSGNGDCRRGSCGGFSDIFRYNLLNEIGGWYCDTDVTCLNNLEELDKNEYIFRKNKYTLAVPNILKCPKNSIFLKKCISETNKVIDENNANWIKPLEIFSNIIKEMKLESNILDETYFGLDSSEYIRTLIELNYYGSKIKLPKYAIHWCNEAIKTGKWDDRLKTNMETPIPTTLYYKLLKKHKLL